MSKEKEEKKPVKVKMSTLKSLVEEGKSKKEIADMFSLNAAQTVKLFKAAKEAGLKFKFKRAVKPRPAAFVLITDENEVPVETSNLLVSEAKPEKVKKADKKDDSDLLQVTNKVEGEALFETDDTTEENEW